jgi:hypothetical protein
VKRPRWVLLGVLLVALSVAPQARASVSFTVLLDALVEESAQVIVGTPTSASSVWEDGRIVTYTKVHVDRVVAGSAATDVWVKTLGGAVDHIGQQVEGEAVLIVGHQSVLFLRPFQGSTVVTARGQGQFSIVNNHLQRNNHAGVLMGARPASAARIRTLTTYAPAAMPAADVLDGKSIDDAASEITQSWKRTHA